MGKNTSIQWTEHTWNPWRGCTKIATGCQQCYMFREQTRYGKDPSVVVRTSKSTWAQARKWNREAENAGRNDLVFACSWSDFWHKDADQWRQEAFGVIDECQNLTFQIPTKRPERIRSMWQGPNSIGEHPFGSKSVQTPDGKSKVCTLGRIVADRAIDRGEVVEVAPRRGNVWLGYSASTQKDLEAGLPHLLACRDLSPVLFLSLEPLVGPIDLDAAWPGGMPCPGKGPWVAGVDWVIVGGESGPNARPCNIQWIRDIVQQCKSAGVPCYVKQAGSHPVGEELNHNCTSQDDYRLVRYTTKHPKAGDPAEWPADIQVRQYPTTFHEDTQ